MILVTTGSNGSPFDRLISVVERFDLDEEVVVQYGPSKLRPRGARCVDYLPFDELSRLVADARVVVAHAGVGSILLCLTHGRPPLVVPRLPSLGEVVDDHQFVLARRLALSGAVTCVDEVDDLPELVRRDATTPVGNGRPRAGESTLASELRRYIDSVASRPAGAPPSPIVGSPPQC
jgi:UDP-N-acetylglucosamine transferase subunit ALG13